MLLFVHNKLPGKRENNLKIRSKVFGIYRTWIGQTNKVEWVSTFKSGKDCYRTMIKAFSVLLFLFASSQMTVTTTLTTKRISFTILCSVMINVQNVARWSISFMFAFSCVKKCSSSYGYFDASWISFHTISHHNAKLQLLAEGMMNHKLKHDSFTAIYVFWWQCLPLSLSVFPEHFSHHHWLSLWV